MLGICSDGIVAIWPLPLPPTPQSNGRQCGQVVSEPDLESRGSFFTFFCLQDYVGLFYSHPTFNSIHMHHFHTLTLFQKQMEFKTQNECILMGQSCAEILPQHPPIAYNLQLWTKLLEKKASWNMVCLAQQHYQLLVIHPSPCSILNLGSRYC